MRPFCRRRPPPWANDLLLQMQQLTQQVTKGNKQMASEDAAIEADVSEVATDITALTTIIENLKGVSVGDTITPQTKSDLDAVVAALSGLVTTETPPAPPTP